MTAGTADAQAAWDEAVAACLFGHDHCSYGGMSAAGGYWLADQECTRDHGERCAWCPEPATSRFVGYIGVHIFGVPACEAHADRWAADHPDWRPDTPPDDEPATPTSLGEIPAVVGDMLAAISLEYLRLQQPFTGFDGLLGTLFPSGPPPEPASHCYQASFGWVHVKPYCHCPRHRESFPLLLRTSRRTFS